MSIRTGAAAGRLAWPARAALIPLALLLAGCGYDRMQELEDRVRVARTDVEALVQRRVELVPNLIETARRLGGSEPSLLDRAHTAREELASAVRSKDLQALQIANLHLSSTLEPVLESTKATSQRAVDPAFEIVESQLAETRAALDEARHEYNRAVRAYNRYIREFPQVMTARVVRARPMQSLDTWELSVGDPQQGE